MRFSEEFGVVSRTEDDDWFDLEVSSDTPLYIDPLLVFQDEDPFWAATHQDVVDFCNLALHYVARAGGNQDSAHWKKAERMLTFPEPKEFALGLSMGHPEGAGTSAVFAGRMAEALDILRVGRITTVDYVEIFALFCDGMGVDRISDVFCNIAKQRFVRYTQQMAARHSISTETVLVRHAEWNRTDGRWQDKNLPLPRSSAIVRPTGVLLCPERFLKDIPRVTPDGFWSWAESTEAKFLRDDLNYEIGEALSRGEKVSLGRELARVSPELAMRYIAEEAASDAEPYDVHEDPKLLVGWAEAGRAAAAENATPLGQPATEDEFLGWVRELMLEFKHAVEETDLWKVFWDDDYAKPRQEKIVQAVATQMFIARCKAADVDLSREVNIGRGPVDFKFSAGWQKRALTEVKLIKSTQFFSGANKQLPQYLRSERISGGFYLCVGFTDEDFEEERVKKVTDTCKALSEAKGATIEPLYVDARPHKPSASKIR